MANSSNTVSKKQKYLVGLLSLLFLTIICATFNAETIGDFDIARREILIRRIGHEILLQAGDSTSRVLPIKTITENEYQIRFENELTFQPDSLVDITQRLLTQDPLARDYVVNVISSRNDGVTFGYTISKNKKDDIVACIGRKQPKAYYFINIKIKPTSTNAVSKGYLLGSLPFLAFVGFIFVRSVKPQKAVSAVGHAGLLSLGSIVFDTKNRKLTANGLTIDLTGTETRILQVFATSPNEIIDRSRLQKEIWEDEGVIVGRSLDMFISKLRKKLEIDANVKINVIRGKGYKLEIGY
jgi:hypothetical protein